MIFDTVPPWLQQWDNAPILFEAPAPIRENKVRPMPATPREIQELEAMLAWANEQKNSGANSLLRERALRDSLARAISYLKDEGPRESIVDWILGALRASCVRKGKEWFARNRRMFNDAMDLISERFPPDEHDR